MNISPVKFTSNYVTTTQKVSGQPAQKEGVMPQTTTGNLPTGLSFLAMKTPNISFTAKKASTEAVLNALLDEVKAGKASDWSYIIRPGNGLVFSFKIDDKKYSLEVTESEENGKTGTLNVTGSDEKTNSYKLTEAEAKNTTGELGKVAYPTIEMQYGLRSGLDVTDVLVDLAEKSHNREIEWKQIGTSMTLNGVDISADGIAEAVLPDGSKAYLLGVSQFLSMDSFIALEKPGLPPVLLSVGDGNEGAAFQLLNAVGNILKKEDEVKKDRDTMTALFKAISDSAPVNLAEFIEEYARVHDQDS